MTIKENDRVKVVSGEYGVGQHGLVRHRYDAGRHKSQHCALVEMDGGWTPGRIGTKDSWSFYGDQSRTKFYSHSERKKQHKKASMICGDNPNERGHKQGQG